VDKHPTNVCVEVNLEYLASQIANLRYDSLSEFIGHLQQQILAQSKGDCEKGRKKLAEELLKASNHLAFTETYIETAWNISKPHMQDDA